MELCKCPYCGEPVDEMEDVDHIGDDESSEHECRDCGEVFWITASISWTHTASCADGKHRLREGDDHPGYLFCTRCDKCVHPSEASKYYDQLIKKPE